MIERYNMLKISVLLLSLSSFGVLLISFDEAEARSRSSSYTCKGVCYGSKSTKTGRARNNYVRGYKKKDGNYVAPYTRSELDNYSRFVIINS